MNDEETNILTSYVCILIVILVCIKKCCMGILESYTNHKGI